MPTNQPETTTRTTFCRICEVLCGLEMTVENNRVVKVIPNAMHIATKGFACPKGINQHHLYDSPDRLKYPMKRVGNEWTRISWSTALSEIGEKVAGIRKDYHPDAIAMYVGTAAGFGVLHPIFAQGFMTGIGSSSMFSSSTQDCSSKFAVAREMYGFPFLQPFPDLEHTECLIIVGANPVISKWSFLQVPDPKAKLKAITQRGGKVYIVDPRKTETAHATGEHVFIRPGTDLFFYLSFLHEIIVQKAIDHHKTATFMTGMAEITRVANEWPAEKTASLTGIAPEMLRKIAGDYIRAKGAALYCSTGVNMGGQGALAFWIQECINAITGNLDRKGGTLVSKGIIDFPAFAAKRGILMRKNRSRVGGFASVNDAYPGAILADEILTPGWEKIRALFVTGGNPLITMAGAERLRDAFKELDLLVTLDILPTETAALAHYALPCTSPLQRPDLPFIFPLMLGLQIKPYLQATNPVVDPEAEQRDEASIYLDLCRFSGVNLFGSRIAQGMLELFSEKFHSDGKKLYNIPQKGMLNTLLRICRVPGFKTLLKSPHGIPRPDHRCDFLEKRVLTSDKKVHLAPQIFVEALEKINVADFLQQDADKPFRLITRRSVKTHNSWTHNYEAFVREPENTNYLYIHPEDAADLGLSEGDTVDVTSKVGTVRLPIRLEPDLLPKTVALPHGWGHQASGLAVAKKTRGVNVNILAPSGPGNIDPLSGMALLTAIPVSVTKSAGTQNVASWNGIRM